jgi:glucosamine--fructose-6-phosphate aminotransferase (isomerizing)
MCGIIGYTGNEQAVKIVVGGLERLEYRGYDSAGVAILQDGGFFCEKHPGKLGVLTQALQGKHAQGTLGMGHVRWATHGVPSRENAHPHLSCDGNIVLVHNGIIENHEEIKRKLMAEGHTFRSETDTECIVHLIEKHYRSDPLGAVAKAVGQLRGSFALCVAFRDCPDTLIGVRSGSPLVAGLSDKANYLASDVPAILPHTSRVVFLEEQTIAHVTPARLSLYDFALKPRRFKVSKVTWDMKTAQKQGYPHFMLKEIFEQPKALHETFAGRIDLKTGNCRFPELNPIKAALKKVRRINIIACGTAWHAGLVGKYAIEELARVPVEVNLASVLGKDTLVIAISQSGETADTLAGLRLAKEKGSHVLSVCNVVGSSVARESDSVLYTRAGPEIGVASTKAYSTQILMLELFAVALARLRVTIGAPAARSILKGIQHLPSRVERALKNDSVILECAQRYRDVYNFMYIGRRYNFPNAYEGALKLKEISYIHAEGYGAGEMKHGPLALVDDTFPTVAIAVKGAVYEKMISNVREIRARRGEVIAIATEGDDYIHRLCDYVIHVPETQEMLSPMVTVVPLQLLAYHVAVARGCDVDQPRNLAKSVTVE